LAIFFKLYRIWFDHGTVIELQDIKHLKMGGLPGIKPINPRRYYDITEFLDFVVELVPTLGYKVHH